MIHHNLAVVLAGLAVFAVGGALGIGLLGSHDHPEERRLARSVRSDDADDSAALHGAVRGRY